MAEPRTLTESFTLVGSQEFVRLQFTPLFAPFYVKEDTVAQPIKNVAADQQDLISWFWNPTNRDVFKAVPPGDGTVVEVQYQPTASNIVIATAPDSIAEEQAVNDPTGIPDPDPYVPLPGEVPATNYTPPTPSGIYSQVLDAPYISDSTTAQAVTAGRLRVTSVTPLVVVFDTHYPGLQRGMNLSIEWPQYGLTGLFFITEIQKKAEGVNDLGHGTCFVSTITAVIIQNTFEQDPPDESGITIGTSNRYPLQPYSTQVALAQRTAVQPDPPQYDRLTFVIGPGVAFVGGDTIGTRHEVVNSGQLIEIHVNTPDPPINQRLVIDLFQDGVSFLRATKIAVDSGVTSKLLYTRFAGWPAPYRMNRGSLITATAVYKTGTGTRTNASNVLVQLVWAY